MLTCWEIYKRSNLMKKIKYLAMAGVVAMLYACGDDSDSGSNSIAAGDGSERHGLVVIDESNSVIKPYLQDAVEGCFMRGLDFSWKTVELNVDDQLSYKYEFVGDTLVLHSGKSFSENGIMYVGGKEGNLNGTWQSTLCRYDHEEEETTCYKQCSEVKASVLKKFEVESEDELDEVDREDFEEEYYKKRQKTPCFEDDEITDYTIKISGDDITIITKDRETEEKEFTDYMNSEYISDLYYAIYEGSTRAPSFYGLFDEDSADVKSYRRKADIEENKKTKTEKSVTFVVAEEDTVSVTVNTVNIDKENGKAEVSMVVKSGKRTCELNYKSGRVNKGDCDADNLAYFNEPSKKEDVDGMTYRMVSYMEDSNEGDFDDCVSKILRAIAKKSSSSDDDDRCSEVMSAYDSCVESMMMNDYSRSEARDYCNEMYSVDYYCGMAKTATSAEALSMSKFKKNRMAQIFGLQDLFK